MSEVMPRNQHHVWWTAVAALMVPGLNFSAHSQELQEVSADELRTKAQWVRGHLVDSQPRLPFSFTYAGRSSGELLKSWPSSLTSTRLDADRTQHVLAWADGSSGVEVRCVAVDYADFPAVEWTVYLRNAGKEDTPILESLQGIDVTIERGPEREFVLHHWKGDTSAADLYQPLEQALNPGEVVRFAPVGGRGSNGAFPYYNLVTTGGGMILAVGWPGQWAASFARDAGRGVRLTAGQELTHLSLKPGEQVRTPLIALLFWQGDSLVRAQNLWRRWMWAHNVPRTADGRLPAPHLFGNTSMEFNEMCNANEENQKFFIDRYIEERVPINFWWMDAGWYPCGGDWPKTGTWEPDKQRFPRGLRAISDHAQARGMRTLVWFEPERVAQGTWLAQHHPEWLVGGTLLNLGRPEARDWLTDHVDRLLREQGISLYRQDFNIDPLPYWRRNDTPDRQGVSENMHIQNYLSYWDALRRRHPSLVIDSCASGGRRNDLETMRRAIALHPTDYNYGDLPAKQAFHASLFQWLPCFGSNTVPVDTVNSYAFRSGHALNVVLGYDLRRKDLDYAMLRKLAAEWLQIAPCYQGDFYPLAPYNRDDFRWIAWQFDRPEHGDGVVEAFRRGKADSVVTWCLSGLDPSARYSVTNLESGQTTTASGIELRGHGLRVEVQTKPGAAVIRYVRLR
jgi:alpha-galactosidase